MRRRISIWFVLILGIAPLHLRADDEATLRARLERDPWMRSGVLRMGELLPWEVLLGELE